MSEQTIFSVAQNLESIHVDLGRVRDFLSILLENIFYKKGEMTDYAMQYSSLVEAALLKVDAHEGNILEMANVLYAIEDSRRE